MKDRLIQWHCASPAHRAKPGDARDNLTIHDGEWAFCPLDSRADDHDWQRRAELERGPRRRPIVLRNARAG